MHTTVHVHNSEKSDHISKQNGHFRIRSQMAPVFIRAYNIEIGFMYMTFRFTHFESAAVVQWIVSW